MNLNIFYDSIMKPFIEQCNSLKLVIGSWQTKIPEVVQQQRGDQAALLLRTHIQTSQAEVRKITLHQVHLARQMGAKAAA